MNHPLSQEELKAVQVGDYVLLRGVVVEVDRKDAENPVKTELYAGEVFWPDVSNIVGHEPSAIKAGDVVAHAGSFSKSPHTVLSVLEGQNWLVVQYANNWPFVSDATKWTRVS